MKITIYTTQSCPFCKMVKEYLNSKGVAYTEIDVSNNPEKAAEAEKLSGMRAVPVVEIGEVIILGFDKEKIDEALSH